MKDVINMFQVVLLPQDDCPTLTEVWEPVANVHKFLLQLWGNQKQLLDIFETLESQKERTMLAQV